MATIIYNATCGDAASHESSTCDVKSMDAATRFSQEGTSQYFCLCHNRLLSFYDAKTLDLLTFTDIPSREVVAISSIGNSNIVAIVPKASNEALLVDRVLKIFYWSFTPNDTIVGVRLRPDIVVTICRSQIAIFNLFDTNKLCTIPTSDNPHSVFDIEDSYESTRIAVPGPQVGELAFYNWLTSESCLEVPVFNNKPIKCVRFCKSGKLIAVASDMSAKVKIITVRSSKIVAQLKLSKKEKVADIRFDEWEMQVLLVTEGNVLKLYDIPAKDVSAEHRMSVKPVATFTLGKAKFWAFFGDKLFEMNVVTTDFMFYRLKYDGSSKTIKRDEGVKLQSGRKL